MKKASGSECIKPIKEPTMSTKQQRDLSALEWIYQQLLSRFMQTSSMKNRWLIARQIAELSQIKQRILGATV